MHHTFLQDLRSGLRLLRKSPGFTLVAVLSLALGIGANTAIFTIINAVFLHPLPVENPSQIAQLYTRDTLTVDTNANFQLTPTSLPNYEDYRDQNSVFSGLAADTFAIPLNWGGQSEPQQILGALVSPNYFDVLGVKAIRGRTFSPDEGKKVGTDPVVVLSHALWDREAHQGHLRHKAVDWWSQAWPTGSRCQSRCRTDPRCPASWPCSTAASAADPGAARVGSWS